MKQSDFCRKAAATIKEYDMLKEADGKVTVCLSGGSDSVSLLFAMLSLKEEFHFRLFAAHVNHMIRGEEAQRDEDFCVDLCKRLDIPLTVGKIDVPRISNETGDSVELAARKERYRFFNLLHEKYGGVFATAHNKNDNAETVLFSFLRNKSPSSLDGIPYKREFYIRPILKCTSDEVKKYLSDIGQSYVSDSTNDDTGYSRNNIRHILIPYLEKYNPSLIDSLCELSDNVKDDNLCMDALALRKDLPDYIALRKRRMARDYFSASNGRTMSSVQLNCAAKAFAGSEEKEFSLPGDIIMKVGRGKYSFNTKEELKSEEKFFPTLLLKLNEWTDFSPHFKVGIFENPVALNFDENIYKFTTSYTLGFDNIILRKSAVRMRMPGDVIRIGGIGKSIKKEFINRKIPKELRQYIPVVTIGDTVAAVPGIGVADGFGVRNGKPIYLAFQFTE